MKKIVQLILSLLVIVLTNNSYAASGDSVMNAPATTSAPSMSYKAATASSGNIYSYTSTTEYQTSTCPAGLTVNGSTIYNSAQRQIIYTYLGSQLVGSQVTAWKDIDTDCSGGQTQNLACPAGYTGTIVQTRKVGTASNGDGTLQYDPWITKSNSCSRTETQVLACPAGYTGNITQQRQITMGIDGSYNIASWVTTANTCVPAGYTFNITVGEYVSTGLWTELYWGASEILPRNFANYGLGYVAANGSMNTVYYAGLRISDIYWNGSPGYFSIFPNSITMMGTDGSSKFVLLCNDVSVNGNPLGAMQSNYGISASYANFQSYLAPYNYIGAKVQITINNCSVTYFEAN